MSEDKVLVIIGEGDIGKVRQQLPFRRVQCQKRKTRTILIDLPYGKLAVLPRASVETLDYFENKETGEVNFQITGRAPYINYR